ncbi:MAG: (d)CMP kinase [Lentisphaeria bacterium]|nr:(d)CMP kinase [Lentisphaeria bacterium]
MKQPVIAIDGPAASGKSTVAALVAQALGALNVNTGAMFRAVTLAGMQRGITTAAMCTEERFRDILDHITLTYATNADGKLELQLDGDFPGAKLRSPEVAALVSPVATLGCVRDYLKQWQRSLAGTHLLVMEGRDIGTAVFPDARWKYFITASPEERARRRLNQSGETFTGATLEQVAAEIAERDRIDSTRAIAPLKPAPDAVLIDTTGMTIEDVVEQITRQVRHEI